MSEALPPWCAVWERLTDALEIELSKEDPDVDRLADLVAERQRLVSQSAERADPEWLDRMIAREQRVRAWAQALHDRIGTSLENVRAGRSVRRLFQAGPEEGPALLDRKI